jgi:hypothetical protein
VATRLSVVNVVGTCVFCWRTLPVEQLHETGAGMLCNEPVGCCREFNAHEESDGWRGHPAVARMAV